MAFGAYSISALIAVFSEQVDAAVIAGIFGLLGLCLQFVFVARVKDAHVQAATAKNNTAMTQAQVDVNSVLLAERGEEIKRLSHRVDQLLELLAERLEVPIRKDDLPEEN